jgi:outer membrane protein OmpA-like peptidoglycan-associated protein
MTFRTSRAPLAVLIASLFFVAMVSAQDLRKSLFTDADAALAKADSVNAEVLAPKAYSKGLSAYKDAEEEVKKGDSIERIRKNLAKAQQQFEQATESSALAEVTFTDTLKAREAAGAARAAELASDSWAAAEKEFARAAGKLEDGNVNSAQKSALKAKGLFRDAELAGVKAGILGDARKLLKKADEQKAIRYAPKTFAKAQSLADEADKELSSDRYETGRPEELASQAAYEARHGFYIAKLARSVKDKDLSVEDIVLDWETPVLEVAAALGISADLSDGYQSTTATSVSLIEDVRTSNDAMAASLKELEGTRAEARQSERLRTQLAEVEALFQPGEARIVREGNDLILRLIGLSFPPGQAVIQTKYYTLLRQVQEALSIFPDNNIVIEGHTDSTGSDDLNLRLSRERADAVAQYLIANLGMSESRVKAVGYGKNRPIANNETAEGRALNRRIDVVIKNARAAAL